MLLFHAYRKIENQRAFSEAECLIQANLFLLTFTGATCETFGFVQTREAQLTAVITKFIASSGN